MARRQYDPDRICRRNNRTFLLSAQITCPANPPLLDTLRGDPVFVFVVFFLRGHHGRQGKGMLSCQWLECYKPATGTF